MKLEQAARKEDPVSTTAGRTGMYIGAGAGAVAGGVIGSGAGGVGALPGAGYGMGIGADVGRALGNVVDVHVSGSPGDILDGSPNVQTNQRKQARVSDPTRKGKVVQGCLYVSVNRLPLARRADQTEQGTIEAGSPNVYVGGPSASFGESGDDVSAVETFVLGVIGTALTNTAKMALRQALLESLKKEGRDAAIEQYQNYLKNHGMTAQASVLAAAATARKRIDQREDATKLAGIKK